VKLFKILLISFLLSAFLLTSCENVRMDYPRSVANFFCKALIKGDLKEAKKLSDMDETLLKTYLEKISGKYADFTVDERVMENIHIEKITFIPKKVENPQLYLEMRMKRVGAEYRVATIVEQALSKEQTVKNFVTALMSGLKEKAVELTNLSPAEIDKAIKTIAGAASFEIMQLTERDSNVIVEVKKNNASKILNMKIEKIGQIFKVLTLTID